MTIPVLAFDAMQVMRSVAATDSDLASCRLGDTGFAYLRGFSFRDLPASVTHYIEAREERSYRVAMSSPYAGVRTRHYDNYISREQAHVCLIAIRRAISKSVYNDAVDILTDNGVPIQFVLEDMRQQTNVFERKKDKESLAPHLHDYVPPKSPTEGFIMGWMKDIFIRLMTSASERNRLIPYDLPVLNGADGVSSVLIDSHRDADETGYDAANPPRAPIKDGRVLVSRKNAHGDSWVQVVINDFLKYARAYSWNYTRGHKVSQSALSYCRSRLDRHWPNRQHGESVTTVYLERFEKEIAYASATRYITDIGDDKIEKKFEDIARSYVINTPQGTPVGLRKEDFEDIRYGTANFTGLITNADESRNWIYYVDEVGRVGDYTDTYRQPLFSYGKIAHAYARTDSYERQRAYVHCAGIAAHVFLEQVGMDPDFVFIRCLEAFILSETGRSRFIPQYGRYSRPFRLSVDTIKSNRNRDNIYKHVMDSTVCEYMQFGWFHFVAFQHRNMEAIKHDEGGMGSLYNLTGDWIPVDDFRARPQRYLGMGREGYRRYHLGPTPRYRTCVAEVGLRDMLATHDAMAIEADICGRINGRFLSPSRRAIRRTKSTTACPGFVRRALIGGLRSGDDIARALTDSEWDNYLASGMTADMLNDIARKLRGDVMAGYRLLAWQDTEKAQDQIETMFSAMVKKEMWSSLVYDVSRFTDIVGKNAGNFGQEWQLGKSADVDICARMALRRAIKGSGFDAERDKEAARKTSFRQMARRSRKNRITRASGKTALCSPSVFAMWRNMSAVYGASSSNLDLSYITFAGRYGMLSRLSSTSLLADPDQQLRNKTFRNMVSFPVLEDNVCSDFVAAKMSAEEKKNRGIPESEERIGALLQMPPLLPPGQSLDKEEIDSYVKGSRARGYSFLDLNVAEKRMPRYCEGRRAKTNTTPQSIGSMDALTLQYDGNGNFFLTRSLDALSDDDFGKSKSIISRKLTFPVASDEKHHSVSRPSNLLTDVGGNRESEIFLFDQAA